MVDTRTLKLVGALVVGGVLLLLAWVVLQFLTRILAWAALLGVALVAAYVLYQLYSGWSAAGDALDSSGALSGTGREGADETARNASDRERERER